LAASDDPAYFRDHSLCTGLATTAGATAATPCNDSGPRMYWLVGEHEKVGGKQLMEQACKEIVSISRNTYLYVYP